MTKDGYATLDRAWKGGDTVELQLDMDVRRIYANPNVRQDIGRVALARGPVLYCVEATDNATPLHGVVLSSSSPIEAKVEPDLLRGVVSLSALAQTDTTNDWGAELYRSQPPATESVQIKAVPYYAWDNREPGEMRVWLRSG